MRRYVPFQWKWHKRAVRLRDKSVSPKWPAKTYLEVIHGFLRYLIFEMGETCHTRNSDMSQKFKGSSSLAPPPTVPICSHNVLYETNRLCQKIGVGGYCLTDEGRTMENE